MAQRARQSRAQIPGWRPKPARSKLREVKRSERRKVRQALEAVNPISEEIENVALTSHEKRRQPVGEVQDVDLTNLVEPKPLRSRRYKPVQKTAFWKRRHQVKRHLQEESGRAHAEELERLAEEARLAEEWGEAA